jgi:hypothetical protein
VPGDEYSVDITRLSPGGDGGKGYYLVRSTGRAHGPRGGRRQVAWLLRVQPQPEPEVPTPQGPKLYSPQPLAEFAWFEILE